jgi:hypothetical protein
LPKELAQVLETGELMQNQGSLVPSKSYECRKLSSMIQKHETDVYLSIEILLANLAMQVNVKFNIEPHQAPDISKAIYKNYYFYSIEEIALVLRMGSEGQLVDEKNNGKIYDRLSKDVIMTWFLIYDSRHREPLVSNTRAQLDNQYQKEGEESKAVLTNGFAKLAEIMKRQDEEKATKEEQYKQERAKYFEKLKNSINPGNDPGTNNP